MILDLGGRKFKVNIVMQKIGSNLLFCSYLRIPLILFAMTQSIWFFKHTIHMKTKLIVVHIYLWSTITVFDFSFRAIMTENDPFGYTFNCAAQFPCRILYICWQVFVSWYHLKLLVGLGQYSNWVHIIVLTQEFEKADVLM